MADFDTFWKTYPSDLCGGVHKKGSRSVAQKSFDKLPTTTQDHVLVALREMIKVCKQERKTHGKTDRWPMASTWLNQARWEIWSEMKTPTEIKHSVTCGCGNKVDHAPLKLCWSCYDKQHPNQCLVQKDQLRKEFFGLGIISKPKDYRLETLLEWHTGRNPIPTLKRIAQRRLEQIRAEGTK